MLLVDISKESKFTCKRSILMEIPRLILLVKLVNFALLVIPKLKYLLKNKITVLTHDFQLTTNNC